MNEEKCVLHPEDSLPTFWMGVYIVWLEADWESLTQGYRNSGDFPAIEAAEADETWLKPWVIDEDVDALLTGFNSLFFLSDDMNTDLHASLVKEIPVLQKVGILWDKEKCAPAMTMDLPMDEAEYLMGAFHPGHVQEYSKELKSMNLNRVQELLDEYEFGGEESCFSNSADFMDFLARYSQGLADAATKGVGIVALCYG